MSATVHNPSFGWARAHWAAVVIVLLSMALAATLGLLTARLVADGGTHATTSVTDFQLRPTDNGCQLVQAGEPC